MDLFFRRFDMPTVKVFFRFILLSLVCFGFISPSFSSSAEPAPYWKDYGIKLKGLKSGEIGILEGTFENLRGLEISEIKINPKTYKKLSRFEELFGFKINGPGISDWILRRTRKIEKKETWTALVNHRKGTIRIGKVFFEELTLLERMYALIHEARHSDDGGYKHSKCPKGFKFISAGQPYMDLEKEFACDNTDQGAYSYQAAFLFELFAYGLFDSKEVGLLYNSSIIRVIQ